MQAGAIVRLEALIENSPPGELDRNYRITWYVVGPTSQDQEIIEGRSCFDLNTAGRTPGAYSVHAVRTARGDQPAAEPAPQPTAEPAAPTVSGMPVAVRSGTRRFEELTGSPGEPPADTDQTNTWTVVVQAAAAVSPEGVLPVSLQRTQAVSTPDQMLWTLIRNRTEAISFRRYREFIDGVMCRGVDVRNPLRSPTSVLNFTGTQAYEVLKQATDTFLMQECGVVDAGGLCVTPEGFLDPRLMESELADPDVADVFLEQEPRRYGRPGTPVTLDLLKSLRAQYYEDLSKENNVLLPYLKIISDRLSDLPLKSANDINGNCYGILRSKLTGPLALELIWSYWHEEGMLVQTLNADPGPVPEPAPRCRSRPAGPLRSRPAAAAEQPASGAGPRTSSHRLTVRRRAAEYEHEYGLTLLGRAVPDRRLGGHAGRRFLQSFHTLLHLRYLFFKEDDDTTVIADGVPAAQRAAGDASDPGRGRAQPVRRHAVRGPGGDADHAVDAGPAGDARVPRRPDHGAVRGAVDGPGRLDEAAPGLDGRQRHPLPRSGCLRRAARCCRSGYGNWSVVNDPQQAANWARYWRPEIQRYIHAYRAATGVDLNERADATVPAQLLQPSAADPAPSRPLTTRVARWPTSHRRCTWACATPTRSCPGGPP